MKGEPIIPRSIRFGILLLLWGLAAVMAYGLKVSSFLGIPYGLSWFVVPAGVRSHGQGIDMVITAIGWLVFLPLSFISCRQPVRKPFIIWTIVLAGFLALAFVGWWRIWALEIAPLLKAL